MHMGYTFKIGNAEPEFSKEDGKLYAAWTVSGTKSEDAPTFPGDELTGNGNSRSPSYSVWPEFCRAAGIYDLFFDDRGDLIGGHPGCILITDRHLSEVRAASKRMQAAATKPPGFCGYPKFDRESRKWITPDEGVYDHNLARILWLEWWMEWAVKNCDTPAIQNT
jgi:hypothetical protein